MDIAHEYAIPAYLESNQLIFEYENVGMYHSVILPVNSKSYEFEPETVIPYDLEIEKVLQQTVDKEGKSHWRLNPIITAQFFVNSHILSEEIVENYPIQSENISLLYCDDSTAVLKIKDNNTHIDTVYLKRLIKQDSTGIWTIIGYDTKNNVLKRNTS